MHAYSSTHSRAGLCIQAGINLNREAGHGTHPEERRRIYEEEKAKLERNSLGYSAGWQMQRVLRLIRSYPLAFALLLGCGLLGSFFRFAGEGDNNISKSAVQFTRHSPTLDAIFKPPSTPAPYPAAPIAAAPPAPAPVIVTREESIRQDMLAVDKSITYEKLKKDADRYDSQAWAFTGKVFQIQESGGRTTALVSLDAWGGKMMWVTANFTTEFVEKDQVYVVGYLAGSYSYTSVAGWNVTVPAIEARAILKPSEAARIKSNKASK
jgi:hypothetical protein